jgi:hypothetical protein
MFHYDHNDKDFIPDKNLNAYVIFEVMYV